MAIHDEALAAAIRSALTMDKRVGGLAIDVRVSGGDVFLKGTVDSLEQVDVARFIIAGVPSVRHVDISEVRVKEMPT